MSIYSIGFVWKISFYLWCIQTCIFVTSQPTWHSIQFQMISRFVFPMPEASQPRLKYINLVFLSTIFIQFTINLEMKSILGIIGNLISCNHRKANCNRPLFTHFPCLLFWVLERKLSMALAAHFWTQVLVLWIVSLWYDCLYLIASKFSSDHP